MLICLVDQSDLHSQLTHNMRPHDGSLTGAPSSALPPLLESPKESKSIPRANSQAQKRPSQWGNILRPNSFSGNSYNDYQKLLRVKMKRRRRRYGYHYNSSPCSLQTIEEIDDDTGSSSLSLAYHDPSGDFDGCHSSSTVDDDNNTVIIHRLEEHLDQDVVVSKRYWLTDYNRRIRMKTRLVSIKNKVDLLMKKTVRS